MGSCCHGPSGSKSTKKNSRLGWWSFVSLALVLALLWVFDGNPLVSKMAPMIVLGLILLWLSVAALRKLGVGR